MTSEAAQFAKAFDRIGRDVLEVFAQLDGIPDSVLHWPLPLPQADSLFTRAIHFIEGSEFWVLVVVGGKSLTHNEMPEEAPIKRLRDLITRQGRWLTALHQILDGLPDSALDVFVVLPPFYRETFGGEPTTVRDCLLYALRQSALQAGHMQFIGQLLADGKRMLHEVAEQSEMEGGYPFSFPSTM